MSDIRLILEAEMEARRRFLEHHPDVAVPTYTCPADLILREGVEMEPAVYDEDVWGPRGEEKQCFHNSLQATLDNWGELSYVEGQAVTSIGIPVMHAWCIDTDGNVVDPTWAGEGRPVAESYMGIIFPTMFVVDAFQSLGYSGSLIDDWQHDYPLLRQPLEELFTETERKARR